jgi:spoIIIJ-associated protein
MEWVEITGRTVEEAKEAALDQLGVDEQDAEFEVLSDAKVGLFGRIREEARVRARVRPTSPRAKDDRRDRRRRRRPNEDANDNGTTTTEGSVATDEQEPVTVGATETEEITGAARDGRRNPSRRRAATANGDGGHEVPLDRQAEAAGTFLLGLLREFGLQGALSTRTIDEDTIEVSVQGDDLGALIGPKGATLSAVQDLARIAVQRDTGATTGRLLIDIGGYRQRRQEALARFTQSVAADVIASKRRRALEPMSSADRKIVHDTVNDIAGVSSVSEGEDPYRHVVLVPED